MPVKKSKNIELIAKAYKKRCVGKNKYKKYDYART